MLLPVVVIPGKSLYWILLEIPQIAFCCIFKFLLGIIGCPHTLFTLLFNEINECE